MLSIGRSMLSQFGSLGFGEMVFEFAGQKRGFEKDQVPTKRIKTGCGRKIYEYDYS